MFQDRIVSFFYLKLFILLIIILVIGAITFRIISEIAGSSFKNNTFSLLIVSKDSKLIYVDKYEKSVMFLALGDIRNFVKGKSTLEASFALGIPINGMIIDNNSPINIADFISLKTYFFCRELNEFVKVNEAKKHGNGKSKKEM